MALNTKAIAAAARSLVLEARSNDTLGQLTLRIVRNRVAEDLALGSDITASDEYKKIIRDAVDAAQEDVEMAPPTPVKQEKKRKAETQEDTPSVQVKKKSKSKDHETNKPEAKEKAKRKPKSQQVLSKDTIEDSDEDGPSNVKGSPRRKETSDGEESGSEDEKPKKKVKDKSKANAKSAKKESKPKKEPKSQKEKEPLDKDQETIKRLKSFVVACGVRKQWGKEFQGLSKPSQQISHLRQLLSDLGMSSRPSLEQAKAIKARRELSKELNDVIEFESKAGVGASANRPSRRNSKKEEETDAKSEDEEPSAVGKSKRPARSILAFLDDQSSDGE